MNTEMSLLNLPDEVILQVIESLDDGCTRPSTYEFGIRKTPSPFLPLSLVCHRLSTLAESFLYKRLRLIVPVKDLGTIHGLSTWTTFHNIRWSLCQRPERYDFIRSLELDVNHVSPSNEENRFHLLTLLKRCPDTISIHLECNRDFFRDPDLYAILKGKSIRSINIDNLQIEALPLLSTFRELKSVSLSNVSALGREEWDEWWWDSYEPPTGKGRQWPVEHLEVHFGLCHPCSIISVLCWIVNLKSLDLTFGYTMQMTDDLTYPGLQRIIDVHSSTLESITLRENDGATLDFRHFPRLQELCIARSQMFVAPPQFLASRLMAPRLTKLYIDFEGSPRGYDDHIRIYHSYMKEFIAQYRSVVATGGIREIELINLEFGSEDSDEFCSTMTALSDDIQITCS